MNPAIGKIISINGIDTNYHDEGEGAPVILLHGSAPGVSAWSNWHSIMPFLTKKRRVIAMDIPGFGFTERTPDREYTMSFWMEHLTRFMDMLEVEKASFVGNSFGGAMTLALATREAERVDRFVLMGSGGLPGFVSEGLLASWSYQPTEANMRELFLRFVYDPEIVTDDLVTQRYQASLAELAEEVFLQLLPLDRRIVGTPTPGLPEEIISAIKHRVLILHGREDRIIPAKNSVRLNELIESSDLRIFGKCGHWVQIEQEQKFQQAVVEFLDAK